MGNQDQGSHPRGQDAYGGGRNWVSASSLQRYVLQLQGLHMAYSSPSSPICIRPLFVYTTLPEQPKANAVIFTCSDLQPLISLGTCLQT